MELTHLGDDAPKTAEVVLGYLNFSSGVYDPHFLEGVNRLFGLVDDAMGEERPTEERPTWVALGEVLGEMLATLHDTNDTFRRAEQAEAVLRLVFDHALPGYRHHHRDLLFHQTDAWLFGPFFIGRVCEAVLSQGAPWDETDRIVAGALCKLNDYIGYRPVAVLETEQEIQPYPHEWVRPVPVAIEGAGVAIGPYRDLIARALEILRATDSPLLFQAWFDPNMLDELAIDPRAYDFDHPVNKRPTCAFGQWDMDYLDNSGYSRRFVLQQVSLDALLARIAEQCALQSGQTLLHVSRLDESSTQRQQYEVAMVEASAVLAGTILMGSGVSGNRPDSHDSDATLGKLMQHVAVYRDRFYGQLLAKLTGPVAEKLRAEAASLRQPYGGARQHVNLYLARRRGEQLQHVHLAQLFAQMGYVDAASRQIRAVSVPSARMQCNMYCRASMAQLQIEQGALHEAAELVPQIEDLLHRAIQCGAMVDPWNILGFGGQYSLFPALENTVYDHRVDDLLDLIGMLFSLYVQIEKEAAAKGEFKLQETLASGLEKLAQWWDQFASIEVGSVEGISGRETSESADHVAAALRSRYEAGTAAGDIAFWQGQIERFHSPKAYALVVEALLEQRDLVAAMALLVHWLSQADDIPLVDEDYSFHELASQWMEVLWSGKATDQSGKATDHTTLASRWELASKFLDYLEANAEEYWQVPQLEVLEGPSGGESSEEKPSESGLREDNLLDDEAWEREEEEEEEEEEDNGLFSAAYEDVTFRGSTDDGFESEMLEGMGDLTDFELAYEADRLGARLTFHTTLAALWKVAALASMGGTNPQRDETLAGWLQAATANQRKLIHLLAAIHRYRIASPRGTQEALLEYDRRRAVKEMLLEHTMATCVEMADTARMIAAVMNSEAPSPGLEAWEAPVGQMLRAILRNDVTGVHRHWNALIEALRPEPLLYVALANGGKPSRIVAARSIQRVLQRLLAYLPRLALLRQTTQLIGVIQDMELDHPVGRGAITGFDQLFQIGSTAIVQCLTVSSEEWGKPTTADVAPSDRRIAKQSDLELIECLERAAEALLRFWLAHSHGVRLSALESVHDDKSWNTLKAFIQRYGADLFTKQFMDLSNLRAILHEGVATWLQSLEEEPGAEDEFRLLRELDTSISSDDAAAHLTTIFEAIIENFAVYIDYNNTTIQSDHGEQLFVLLDFLRLRAAYDRVAWNLRPVVLTHNVLVQSGRDKAAVIWRNAVAARTTTIADEHLAHFETLVQEHGMRLSSIADRLGERFVRPLALARLRALVQPAVDELHAGRSQVAFTRLEEGIDEFLKSPSGGFELPSWLDALEQEVDIVQMGGFEGKDVMMLDPYLDIPQVRLSSPEAWQQIKAMTAEADPEEL